MSEPNFFMLGVPKAGTTSLYHYLRQHPQVYMSPVKEPAFFAAEDLDSGRYYVRPMVVRDRRALEPFLSRAVPADAMPLVLDWDAYLELFRGARDQPAIGEASVGYYFHLPSVARSINARVPDARLIVVLRDVADRLFRIYSGGQWRNVNLTFRGWLESALDGGDAYAHLRGAIEVGRYASHLQRWLDVFPRGQLKIVLFEDYRANAAAVVADIFAFLGVAPGAAIDTSRRHNEALAPRVSWLRSGRGGTLNTAAGLALSRLPPALRQVLGALYYRRLPDVAMDPADRRLVIDHYRDEIVRTAELIGRDLSAWLRV